MGSSKLYCALGYACNNNCLMCVVDSEKKFQKNLTTAETISYFGVLENNPDVRNIEFSGGEPTIRQDFLDILEWIFNRHPKIVYTIFSNGRRFSDIDFANRISEYPIADLIIAIHGKDSKTHDHITQRPGSFNETFMGVRNLSENSVNLTLKIIPNKLNYTQIPDIVRMIVNSFPGVRKLSFNGLDVRGHALDNKDQICVKLSEVIPYIQKGISIADGYGLNVCTYSIPRCLFDPEYRKFVGKQKNTDYKYKSPLHDIDKKKDEYGYGDNCNNCISKDDCAGCWNSYLDAIGNDELEPIGDIKKSVSMPGETQGQKHIVDIIGTCNNDCLFCLFCGSRDEKISHEKIIEGIDKLGLKRGNPIILSGGEPTLRDELAEIIQYSESKGYEVSMISNGRRFSDKSYTKKIAKSGLNSVTICIHGPGPKLHDSITQKKGSFDETIAGIKNLMDAGVNVKVKVVVNKLNHKLLEKIVDYVNQNLPNVNRIVFASLSIKGNALKNKERVVVRLKDCVSLIEKAVDRAGKVGITCDFDMFPYCVFDKKYYRNIHTRKHDGVLILDGSNNKNLDTAYYLKGRFPICDKCKFVGKCPGYWKNYVMIYGDSELKYIR